MLLIKGMTYNGGFSLIFHFALTSFVLFFDVSIGLLVMFLNPYLYVNAGSLYAEYRFKYNRTWWPCLFGDTIELDKECWEEDSKKIIDWLEANHIPHIKISFFNYCDTKTWLDERRYFQQGGLIIKNHEHTIWFKLKFGDLIKLPKEKDKN